MSSLLADARFLCVRAVGLARRGWISLRTRGWRASLQRVGVHARVRPIAAPSPLYQPNATAFEPFALSTAAEPRASVVIPVYNHFPHTLACLRALAEHPTRVACEVIVVDDGSTDETEARI